MINRTQARVDKTGEVFTPAELVNEILDALDPIYYKDVSKTICEPSVGEGIFLVEILRRRLAAGNTPTTSLQTLYGVDLMPDNVKTCRKNLLLLAGDTPAHQQIVENNIVCKDALNYNFDFYEKEKVES